MEFNTKTLGVRDHAPLFALRDRDGITSVLRDLAGKAIVLIFYVKDDIPACTTLACAFKDQATEFDRLDTRIISISIDTPQARAEFAAKHGISYALLSDPDLRASKLYGVCQEIKRDGRTDIEFERVIFLLDPNLRIVKIYNLRQMSEPVTEILEDIKYLLPKEEPRHIPMQAPVLLIPNVISPNTCRDLIEIWSTQGHGDSGFMKREGESTVGYIDYSHKVRKDHFIEAGQARDFIDRTMQKLVFPEIEKAFDYEVTRREAYKIACYESERGGYFRPHRDNTTGGTKHRKFAMTLNLNVGEYEGGYLRFPEYAPHLYKPETGSAVIFSCSLLHEATDVTAGRRFTLLSFFYSDREAEQRDAYEQRAQNDYDKFVVKT